MQSLRLLPHLGASVDVQLEPGSKPEEDPLLRFEEGGRAQVAFFNRIDCSCFVEAGTQLGEASVVTLIQPDSPSSVLAGDPNIQDSTMPVINHVMESEVTRRRDMLCELMGEPQ